MAPEPRPSRPDPDCYTVTVPGYKPAADPESDYSYSDRYTHATGYHTYAYGLCPKSDPKPVGVSEPDSNPNPDSVCPDCHTFTDTGSYTEPDTQPYSDYQGFWVQGHDSGRYRVSA